MQQDMKSYSLFSDILKPPYLLTQVFNENNKAQENLFNCMFNFGAREEWRNWIIATSSYIDV